MSDPTLSLLKLPEVLRRTSLSRATLYRFVKSGYFPAQIRLGPNRVAWSDATVDKWIEARVAESKKR